METMRVRLTFTDEILGTASARPDVHEKFIASKAPDAATREQEVAAVGVEQAIKDAMTVFPKNENGDPIFWPYQVLGMFKSAQQAINQSVDKSNRKESKQYMASYKSKLDLGVFIKATDSEWGDRSMIVIHMPEGTEMSNCERPLRCETMQGPRVSLANSETCPIGSWIEFDIRTMTADLMERVRSYLDFGLYNGLGQWRNSGKGRYKWDEIGKDGKIVGGNNEHLKTARLRSGSTHTKLMEEITMALKITIGIVFGACGFAALMAALAPKTELDWRDDNAAQEDWCGRYREGRDA